MLRMFRMQQSQTNLTYKERCRVLRYQGYSIGQIAKMVGRSESTVHWHVRDIVLTTTQRLRLHDKWRAVMVKVNARRQGRPLKPVFFRTPIWSKELVHLVSHLAFDGRVDRYGCSYYSRSRSQALHVRRLLRRLLAITTRMRLRSNGVWVVSRYNVAIAAWLSQKEKELRAVIAHRTMWQQQWLKAFFDDEGHIHIHHGIRRVRASQDDPEVLRTAKECLSAFGIQSRIDRRARAVEITGRENLVEFQHRINFSAGLRVNANRKNGIWHHHIEKRRLLQLALDSYKASTALSQLGR